MIARRNSTERANLHRTRRGDIFRAGVTRKRRSVPFVGAVGVCVTGASGWTAVGGGGGGGGGGVAGGVGWCESVDFFQTVTPVRPSWERLK